MPVEITIKIYGATPTEVEWKRLATEALMAEATVALPGKFAVHELARMGMRDDGLEATFVLSGMLK